MKKIFLIIIGVMMSISINNFSATKKRATGKVQQQSPQSMAVNFINNYFKAYTSGEIDIDQWVYDNSSITQRYRKEYRNEVLANENCSPDGTIDECSFPIRDQGGDLYTGKFKATNYNPSTGYVTVKPIQSFSNESYKIKVIKSNGKWMVDDVVPWWKEITY
ncbi:hypothetical protein AB8B23_10115 [Leptotrichia sp. HSP-342]|uniref:DUF3828 domain-containing protein n=1 Tax=Leptotrichia mesophila TaxID=3239303 RepID=A0AB39V915_9FUSO